MDTSSDVCLSGVTELPMVSKMRVIDSTITFTSIGSVKVSTSSEVASFVVKT